MFSFTASDILCDLLCAVLYHTSLKLCKILLPENEINVKYIHLITWLNTVRVKQLKYHKTYVLWLPHVYIGWSEVTIIYGHDMISMLWGNIVYCVKYEICKILFPWFA